MRRGFRWVIPFLVTVLLAAGTGTAWAVPPLPASFYGEVQITGFTVQAGDLVKAYVPDVAASVGEGTIQTHGGGLVYTIDVNGDDDDTTVKDGGTTADTITFKIGDQVVAQATWAQGNHHLALHPPATNLATDSPVLEGSPVTLAAGGSTDAGGDIASYAFDCNGDGMPDGEPGMASSTTCTFFDGPSEHTVGVQVVDLQGGVSSQTATVKVNNVVPIVTLPADTTIYEGGTFTGSGSFSDPGADTWTVTVNYGDSAGTGSLAPNSRTLAASQELADNTIALNHRFVDSGAYQVTVDVDDGTGIGSKSMKVTADNVAPTGNLAHTGPVSEGGSSTLSFTDATDPSPADLAAGLHYSFACDGKTESLATTYANAQAGTTQTCPFPTAGTYPVKGRIFDKDNGYNDYSLNVDVANVAPAVSLASGTASLNEGGEFTGNGSFIDPGADTWAATVDYGDGSPAVGLTLAADKTFSLAHTYTDNRAGGGNYTVKVTVSDTHDGSGDATGEVTVNNVPPTATFNAPAAVDEGTAIALTLSDPQDPSTKDTTTGFQYAFDCGTGAGFGAWSTASTASCPTSAKGSRVVQAKIKDKDGGETGYSRTVEIEDVVPANANAGQSYAGIAGDPVMLSGSADNCLEIDGCTFTWKLGTSLLGNGASLNHRWNRTGTYLVTLEVSDDDGNPVTASAEVTIAGRQRTVMLQPGWNLVSFNVIPDDLSVAKVFESIAGKWDLAYAWDGAAQNWRRADLVDYPTDTLSELDEKQGFWIHVTSATAVEFKIAGSLPGANTQIGLFGEEQEWNLVSLPVGAGQTLSPTAIPNLSMVYQYRAGEALPWHLYDVGAPAWANDLSAMSPMYGYWVKVTGDGTWDVAYGNP